MTSSVRGEEQRRSIKRHPAMTVVSQAVTAAGARPGAQPGPIPIPIPPRAGAAPGRAGSGTAGKRRSQPRRRFARDPGEQVGRAWLSQAGAPGAVPKPLCRGGPARRGAMQPAQPGPRPPSAGLAPEGNSRSRARAENREPPSLGLCASARTRTTAPFPLTLRVSSRLFLMFLTSKSLPSVPRQYQIINRDAPQRSPAMAGKKVLIVYAHQEPKSFNGALLKIAVEELTKQGCSVTVSDLYAMQFEPRATRNDIVGGLHNSEAFNYGVETWEAYKRGGLSKDLVEEQKKVQEADLLIFQFPLFWFNMPAILKGWMDRVLVQGFAYDLSKAYDGGLLQGKLSLFSFTTGGSQEMYSKGSISGDIRYILWPMQHGIMHFCGVKVLEPHICYAPACVSEEKRKEMLTAWTQRLKTLWKEEPIDCSPDWYFK